MRLPGPVSDAGRNSLLLFILLASCHATETVRPESYPGKILWTSPGAAFGQPAADDSTVFFGTTAHELIAVDRGTGERRWRAQTTVYDSRTLFGDNVLLVGNYAIFGDYVVTAFDRRSGQRRWTFDPERQGLAGYGAGLYLLATDGEHVFAGSGSGHAYAINALGGSPLWVTTLATDGNSSVYDPVIDGETVYFVVRHFTNPITGLVAAIDRLTGAIKWTYAFPPEAPVGSGPIGHVVPYGNVVYVPNDDGRIYALDRITGTPMFTIPRRPDVLGLDDARALILAGSTLVATSTSDFIEGFDAATGTRRWEFDAGEGAASSNPMATDGTTVYVTYLSGSLAAMDVATGQRRWLKSGSQNPFYIFPLVQDTLILAPRREGLVAIRK